MFRTTHIRSKLAVALAVPLVALVAVAGFEVLAAKQDVDLTRSQSELASASLGPGSLVTHLQNERNRASIGLIGLDTELPVATNGEARPLTDAAAEAFRAEIEGRGGVVEAAFAPAFDAYADLADIRSDMDTHPGPHDLTNDVFANEVFSRYTTIIETFFDATSSVALSVDSAELRNGVEIVDAATRQSEMRARIVRSLVLGVVTGTADEAGTVQEIAALLDRARGFDDDIRTNATGPYEGVADETFAEADVRSFLTQVEAFLADGTVDINSVLASVRTTTETGYQGLRTRAAELLMREAKAIEDDAIARQQLFVLVAAGALILAVLVTWAASRSITRPLRSLQAQADEMATATLPAAVRQILETPLGDDVVIPELSPIEVSSKDEVRDVAAALNAVQSSALDLAVEQAVLRRNISDSYINLGRRNQNLLSRQLDFITDLERNEADPDALEGLFKLDHLATRMRRNAESLLVLAGVEPPRQWSAPVKVSDVVRAALGEVEDYKRVIVRHLEPAALTGAVASDIAHVLAELIENGLSFSPPDQSVEVKGRLTPAGYTIAINDNGLGMSAEELDRANRRLAGTESFTVAPSRYLGHYVAGHLASRLGVRVELQASPAGGITARVDVPMVLVANDETDPSLRRPERAAQTRPAATPAPAPVTPVAPVAPVARVAQREAPPTTTPNGLPRRGDRPAPTVNEPAAPEPMSAEPAIGSDRDPWSAEPMSAEPAIGSDLDPWPAAPPATEPSWPGPATTPAQVSAAEPSWPESVNGSAQAPAAEAEPEPAPWPQRTGAAHMASTPGEATAPTPAAAPSPVEESSSEDAPSDEPAAPLPSRPMPQVASRGFGGLAVARPSHGSMYSVAARAAREGTNGDGGHEPVELTSTGLPKRVPGAQRPDAAFGRPPAAEAPAAAGPLRATPEDVYSFLSSFQSGVAKGRADAHSQPTDESQEDAR